MPTEKRLVYSGTAPDEAINVSLHSPAMRDAGFLLLSSVI